jgi:hypothetical protein
MRGFTLRAVPVCFTALAVGCFSTNGSVSPSTADKAQNADKTQTADKPQNATTRTYWGGVSAALAQKPAGGDLPSMVQVVRAQTNALRELSSDGVDQTLVAAVNEVIKCEDEVLRLAEVVDNDATVLRSSRQMVDSFSAANRRAADAKKRLRELRDGLNVRYGGGFAPLAG